MAAAAQWVWAFFSVVQWVFSYMVENHKHMFAVEWYRSHVTIFFPFYRGTVSFLIWYREISILLWYTLSLVICCSLLSLLLPTTSFHLRAASNYIRQFYLPSVHGFEYATLSVCLHYRPQKIASELRLGSWWMRMASGQISKSDDTNVGTSRFELPGIKWFIKGGFRS